MEFIGAVLLTVVLTLTGIGICSAIIYGLMTLIVCIEERKSK